MTYIDEVLARTEKATRGPWNIESGTYGNRITYVDSNYDRPSEKYTAYLGTRDRLSDSYNQWAQDADFIAHARTDVPELARRLKRAIGALREVNAQLNDDVGTVENDGSWETLVHELEAPPEDK